MKTLNHKGYRGTRRKTFAIVCFLCGLFVSAQTRKKAPPAPAPELDAIELSADPAFHQVLSNDRVQVFRVDLASQASTQLDKHPRDYIVLALTAAHLQAVNGKNTNELKIDPEGMQVMKGGWDHSLVNLGDSPVSIVMIIPRAKLDPEHAICGLGARACRSGEIGDELGKFTESVLFDTAAAKLTQAEVAPGAQVPPTEYVNPVLIVATTDCSLADIRKVKAKSEDESDTTETKDLQLKVGDVAYLPGATTDALKNSGNQDARFVLLTLRPTE